MRGGVVDLTIMLLESHPWNLFMHEGTMKKLEVLA